MIRFIYFTVLLLFTSSLQAQNIPGGNSDKPIEITADQLEVLQEQNLAIFTGHVVAIQGNVRLTSEKMTVHYRHGEERKAGQDAIKKIIVERNVFLSTPEETASGDNGVYQVDDKTIYLNKNVVLTRGKNILKGNALVYNMQTGKSQLNSAGPTQAASGEKGGRVRALFVQEEKKK